MTRGVASGPFVVVPMSRGTIRTPAWSKRASLAGLGLRAPCRRLLLVAHHLAWVAVAVAGPRLLGRPTGSWDPAPGPDIWHDLCRQWTSAVGPFDGLAVRERPQRSRVGFAVLLLRDDRPVGFVKVHRCPTRVRHTHELLTAMAARPSTHFKAPTSMGYGKSGGWAWVALSAIPPYPHRPSTRVDVAPVIEDLQDRLREVLDPDEDVPGHWQPMHGDLTPWNLRRMGLRSLWLLDWDGAGWGPPGADAVYYASTAAMLKVRTPTLRSDDVEAVRFWRGRVQRRSPTDFDHEYNHSLASLLESMDPGG